MDALTWLNGGWKTDKYARVENGKLGIDVDGLYGFQCMDFVVAYSRFLGAPFKPGNAISLKQPQAGWDWVTKPRAGDVHVMPYVSNGVNYGHTGGVVQVDTIGGFYSIDQNWFNPSLTVGSPPAKVYHKNFNAIGFLRFKGDTMNLSAHYAGRAVKACWGRDITKAELAAYTKVEEATMLKRIIDDPQTDKWFAKVELLKKGFQPLSKEEVTIYVQEHLT